jgi:Domain of unknown function (DUF4192)
MFVGGCCSGFTSASVAGMTTAVARLSSPGDLVAVVPHLVGFVPTESIVLMALRGRRRRLQVTVRLDLPEPADVEPVAASLVTRLRCLRADAVVAVVYTDDGERLARRDLIDALADGCRAARIELTEAILVRGGRFWSYTCSQSCCPAEGTPLDDSGTGPVGLVQAETALSGRVVLADRAELEGALGPPVDAALTAAFRRAGRDPAWTRMSRAERLSLWRSAVDAWPGTSSDGMRLALALQDVPLRDEVATWVLDQPEALLAVLRQLAHRTPAPWNVPVCTVLAWASYAEGDGGIANVALDKALAADPTYSLAVLLRTAVDGMVPPAQIRGILRASGTKPSRDRPGTTCAG